MQRPIPTLRGTLTHTTAVELYQRHHPTSAEVCARCGRTTPCPVRASAASVIAAAGEDAGRYDTSRMPLSSREPDFGQMPPERMGWTVSGRSRPPDPDGLLYERDN